MIKNVLLASFNSDYTLSYSINYTKPKGAKYNDETVYILDGEQVSIEQIRPIADKFATPASIDLEGDIVVRLEITTK